MKALVGAFNQEKALVGAFSVIVKTDCETDGALNSTAFPQGYNRLLRSSESNMLRAQMLSAKQMQV